MNPISLGDLEELSESVDFEAKKAAGADGRGECPRSLFESYSAMANTDGGVILLGAEERDGRIQIAGITDVARVQKALWDGINNRQRVSANLLADRNVEVGEIEGKGVILVRVPRATRRQRPVHVGENPMTGTYIRNFEGDYRCDEETVRRMLAERVEDSRDDHILPHYSFDDLDSSTFARYRNYFKAKKPDHPWNGEDDQEFLRLIGGWRRDRETNTGGVTAAGLLMFGRHTEINEVFPFYMVDYQERPEPKADGRWIDRVIPDGTWSGNLFDFYERVIQRLFRDLKVPFKLKGDRRVDETPVHEALREALVNALVHADYTGRVSVLVAKRPDMFGFRNPGTLRVPIDLAVKGGNSDCRNRLLQAMFRHVGLGEQAGSGLPRIYAAWREQQWRAPEIDELKAPPEQTIVQLRMVSLLPVEVILVLEERFPGVFRHLSEVQRLALATVELEGQVTHERLREMADAHSRDLTVALASLIQKGFLESAGSHKLKTYFFPGQPPPSEPEALLLGTGRAIEHSVASSEHKGPRSEHTQGASSEHSGQAGANPPLSEWAALEAATSDLRSRKRAPPTEVSEAITRVCSGRFLTLSELSRLLGRKPDSLRVHYLAKLLATGQVRLRYPDTPTHPDQGYTAETDRTK